MKADTDHAGAARSRGGGTTAQAGGAAAQARAIGFWGALALVVGNLIGSGIYLLPATLAPLGGNATWGWVATIAGAMCLSVVFARLAAALPCAGGPFAFADAAFGPAIGFATAWSYWTLVWVGNGAVAVGAVSALSLAVPALAPHAAIASLVLVWAAVAVNIAGVGVATQFQVVTTVLKILPLLLVLLLAGWLIASQGSAAVVHNPPVPLTLGAISGAAALTFWGFLGVESATVPADKVVDAQRNVPRATLIGTAATGAIYLAVSLTVAALMPRDRLAASPAPIADLLGATFGVGMAQVVALFAAISALGALNGFVLLQGEVPRAMARGGVFPRWFGAESARGVPVRAHLVAGVLVTLVTLANFTRGMGDLFAFVAAVSLASGMFAYLACALAAVRLLRTDMAARAVAIVSAAFIVWIAWGLGTEANLWALVLLAAGAPVYLFVRRAAATAP